MAVAFLKTFPILRIFSVEKAKDFYVDYLGSARAVHSNALPALLSSV